MPKRASQNLASSESLSSSSALHKEGSNDMTSVSNILGTAEFSGNGIQLIVTTDA